MSTEITQGEMDLFCSGVVAKMSRDQIRILNAAVSARLDTLNHEAKYSFRVGDKVSFTSRGTVFTGVITDKMIKYIRVKCETPYVVMFKVTPSILKKI